MDKPFKDRRKFVRIYRHFILSYYLLDNPSVVKEMSQINNISQGGLSFSVTEPLAAGEKLGIEVKTPFLSDRVHLQGEVLECREKIAKLIYEVRLKFNDLSETAKDILIKIEQYAHKEA